jgi:hypothetical protein
MKLRYKILIAAAVVVGIAAAIHFGGPLLVDALIALHS